MAPTSDDRSASVRDDPVPPTARPARAHAFFWAVLAAAAAVSITGNATQALLHDTRLPVVAAAVAIIPPLALLAAVHGVSVLSRARAGARGTRLIATAMTALIAAGAFWLSFTALRALAVTAGVPPGEAWLWPLIIEGSMAQSTVALLALAHSRNATTHRAHGTRTTSSDEHPIDADRADNDSVHTAYPDTVTTTTPAPALSRDAVRTLDTDRTGPYPDAVEVAARLCARDPGRRRDPALVARALALHQQGWTATRIATELNKSRSTISRILNDANTLDAVTDDPAAELDTDTQASADLEDTRDPSDHARTGKD